MKKTAKNKEEYGETCEYDLKRWLIIRHITQLNEIVSVH